MDSETVFFEAELFDFFLSTTVVVPSFFFSLRDRPSNDPIRLWRRRLLEGPAADPPSTPETGVRQLRIKHSQNTTMSKNRHRQTAIYGHAYSQNEDAHKNLLSEGQHSHWTASCNETRTLPTHLRKSSPMD